MPLVLYEGNDVLALSQLAELILNSDLSSSSEINLREPLFFGVVVGHFFDLVLEVDLVGLEIVEGPLLLAYHETPLCLLFDSTALFALSALSRVKLVERSLVGLIHFIVNIMESVA